VLSRCPGRVAHQAVRPDSAEYSLQLTAESHSQRPAPAHRARKLAREGADPGAGRDASKRAKAFQPVLAGRTATGNGAADAPGQLLRDAGRDVAGRTAAQRHVGITDGVQCLVPAAPATAPLVNFSIFSSSAGFCRDRDPWLQCPSLIALRTDRPKPVTLGVRAVPPSP